MTPSTQNPSSSAPGAARPAPVSANAEAAGATLLLDTFQLFDIAERAAQFEAAEWDEEPGMNLFLEDSILLVRRELEVMPHVSSLRETPDTVSANADSPSEYSKRPRIFVMEGSFSAALKDIGHYKQLAKQADIWIFGVQDVLFPATQGIHAVPLTPGTTLTRERTVVVDSPYFKAALFAIEAGHLEESDASSRYYEGYLTARPQVLEDTLMRLGALLGITPLEDRRSSVRRAADDLTLSWHSRLNTRFLESLEGQKLALRARSRELENLLDDRRRLGQLTTLARGYLGDRTWHEFEVTIEKGGTVVADRREELTICFCDLVGFTRVSERLHPSEVATFLNDHFARLHDIVRSHGGWVDKFIGDAMLAIFENPVEAMTASQKMVRETRAVRVNEHMEQSVQVRVGLNTGIVAVANLGVPERRERTVLGDAVNLAQRLQTAAEPRTVMISERTFSRLPFAIARTLESMELQVKGKADIVAAYQWSVHSERRAPNEGMALRGSLVNAARRAPLAERLGDNRGSSRAEQSEPTPNWAAIHEPGYDENNPR
jgi:class 3 adenylate cyclase